MQKIALLHYSYPPDMGGVELLMRDQAHVLAKLGADVLVLTGGGEETNPSIKLSVQPTLQSILKQDEALQDKFVRQGLIDESFRSLVTEIRAILDQSLADRDVVIVHNMLTLIHNLPFIAAFRDYVRDNPEKKYIVWTHDQTFIDQERITEGKTGVNLSPEQLQLLMSPIPGATYVVISETFGKLFSEIMGIPYASLHVIPNGLELQRFYQLDDTVWELMDQEGLLRSYPLIFSPVNILQRKNILYSLDVVAELKKTYPSIKYVITGKPSIHRSIQDHYEEIQKKVAEHGLQDTVVLLKEKLPGTIEHQVIKAMYSLSDAVFYFSKSENFGLPILEAALFKTPVFASNLRVFQEIGGTYLTPIDYKTETPSEAAKKVHAYLSEDREGLFHAKVRQDYNLHAIMREKLFPLLTKI